MTSFDSIEFYNPLFVLIIGLVTFLGLTGFGLWLLNVTRISLESPWRQVSGALLGVLSMSLMVQAAAIGAVASKPILIGIWMIIMFIGLFVFIREEVWKKKISLILPAGWAKLPFLLLLMALGTNLLAAMAPSSKIDELYQYMTLPSRIVSDGELRFYLLPSEGAILPHMLFQISLTPLHAMGFPDAGNIISWALITMLVWFGWKLTIANGKSTGWAFLVLACLVTGIYPVIWNVTGGSYSMGDLATAAAVVALLSSKELLLKTGANTYSWIISFLVMCSVASKVTLLPLGLAILVLMLVFTWKSRAFNKKTCWTVPVYILSPWIIFYLPLFLWTFVHSGSPYGPLLAGFFDFPSVYDLETIRHVQQINREVNLPSFYTIVENILTYFPALLWIGVLVFLVDQSVPAVTRLTGLILLILQTLILGFIIIFDPRFYGGLLQGILIIWLMYDERSVWKKIGWFKNRVVAGSVLFLMPWLALQIFYASQFFPVALGFQDKMEFYHEKIAFTKDYLALDKILPKDAVLVIKGENEVRLNISFAPRPVFLSKDRPSADKKIYLFCINQAKPLITNDYQIDSLIYCNEKAVITTYRNPFRPSILGKLDIYSVVAATKPAKIK
jgi:hypothetical protein